MIVSSHRLYLLSSPPSKLSFWAGGTHTRISSNLRVTRAEALAIFAQAYGIFQFPDVSISEILADYPDAGAIPNWAIESLATALYEGFVNIELGTNKINPLKPMTRGDIAYALSKYLERLVKPGSLPVPDEPPNRGVGH